MAATTVLLFITGDRSAHMSKADGVRSTYVSVRQGQSDGPGGVASHHRVSSSRPALPGFCDLWCEDILIENVTGME